MDIKPRNYVMKLNVTSTYRFFSVIYSICDKMKDWITFYSDKTYIYYGATYNKILETYLKILRLLNKRTKCMRLLYTSEFQLYLKFYVQFLIEICPKRRSC